MSALKNGQQEKFCQGVASGKQIFEAYQAAGYTGPKSAASNLMKRETVKARLAELQERTAKKAVKTAADIIAQLDEDRQFARAEKAPAAAISATMGQAKVSGLLKDQVEHSGPDGGPIELSDADLARHVAFLLTKAARQSSP